MTLPSHLKYWHFLNGLTQFWQLALTLTGNSEGLPTTVLSNYPLGLLPGVACASSQHGSGDLRTVPCHEGRGDGSF